MGKPERRLEPRVIQVLVALASKCGQFRSKEDLISEVWAGRAVGDDSLTRAIYALRIALNDDPRNPSFIETRNNVGYRLIAPVRRDRLLSPAATTAALLLTMATLGMIFFHGINGGTSTESRTVAVIPFVNLSGSVDDRYVASAMTDALITRLAQKQDVRVISRTSVSTYTSHPGTAGEIADELGADLLVEGSVQTLNGKIRVGARLIDPLSNTNLWARQFDRSIDNTLALQREISNEIASHIGGSMDIPDRYELTDLSRNETQKFMQARYELASGSVTGAKSALTLFRELNESRPEFGPAHLGRAESILILFKAHEVNSELLVQAARAARHFESLAGPSADSHRCIGQISLILNWNFVEAEDRYRKAILSNASDTITRRKYAWLLVAQRRYGEAEAQIDQIRMLDPQYYDNAELATLKLYSGNIPDAIEEFERLDAISRQGKVTLRTMAMAYLAAGREYDAREALVRTLQADEQSNSIVTSRYSEMASADIFHLFLENNVFRSPIVAAGFHMLLGDADNALTSLERAVDNRDPSAIFIGALPELVGLHGHPRFQELLDKIGIEAETSLHVAHSIDPSETLR